MPALLAVMARRILPQVLVLVLALAGCVETPTGPRTMFVLVFSRTAGFRHSSIPAGIQAIRTLGAREGFDVEATEAPAAFTGENLARFRVVAFLNTTGDVLDGSQERALEEFIQRGGGFVGIHSAADTEYDWAWYGGLVGAYFASHPAIQSATLHVSDRTHPSTSALPPTIMRTDEWYNFRENPRTRVAVLIALDESSYVGGTMGADHPLSWYHEYDGGRAWYTAMGHTEESYGESQFLDHLAGGIAWAAGARP